MEDGDKEILRHAVLESLVARHPAALPVPGIARRLSVEVPFAVETAEVESALAVLEGKGLVEWFHDDLGGSKWYRATADGVLRVERKS